MSIHHPQTGILVLSTICGAIGLTLADSIAGLRVTAGASFLLFFSLSFIGLVLLRALGPEEEAESEPPDTEATSAATAAAEADTSDYVLFPAPGLTKQMVSGRSGKVAQRASAKDRSGGQAK